VYRAHDRRLCRDVAIKVFDRDVVQADRARRMREFAIHGALDHPAVVPLYDCGTEDGWTYLVMKLVDGPSLTERLLEGPLPADEVTAVADRLAGALEHLHAQGVTHRDLKPANILLGPEGPVLVDFGIAHALDSTRVTRTGTVAGTAAYMAPEQVAGESAGPPADIYALGLVLLECLTGEREYPGTIVESAMARLTRQPRLPESLPEPMAAVIARMTAREPDDRPSAQSVRQSLRRPELATSPPTVPLPRHRGGTKRAPIVAAGLIAAAGALVLPLLLSGKPVDGTSTPQSPSVTPPASGRTVAPSSAPDARPAGQGASSRQSGASTPAPPRSAATTAGSRTPPGTAATSTGRPTPTPTAPTVTSEPPATTAPSGQEG
jgi:serine/threonine protein kinase